MPSIEKTAEQIIFENPSPQSSTLHARFPCLVPLPSGELLAAYTVSEIIDVSTAQTYLSRSSDQGHSWHCQGPLHDIRKRQGNRIFDETLKPLLLDDGSLIAAGYRFERDSIEQPTVNPKTNGLINGPNLISFSRDLGKTWTAPQIIDRPCPEMIETSGPPVQLRSGDLLLYGPPFLMWDGSNPTGQRGLLLRSADRGKSWRHAADFYNDQQNGTTAWESRICEMQPGRLVAIAWSYNIQQNKHFPNHVTVSHDDGISWSQPLDTGHFAQASNLLWLHDNLLLSIHAHRAGADIGLYVRLIDFTDDRWTMLAQLPIWGKARPQDTSKNVAGQFHDLQFGQPSLLQLPDGEILAYHWCIENSSAIIKAHRLRLTP